MLNRDIYFYCASIQDSRTCFVEMTIDTENGRLDWLSVVAESVIVIPETDVSSRKPCVVSIIGLDTSGNPFPSGRDHSKGVFVWKEELKDQFNHLKWKAHQCRSTCVGIRLVGKDRSRSVCHSG